MPYLMTIFFLYETVETHLNSSEQPSGSGYLEILNNSKQKKKTLKPKIFYVVPKLILNFNGFMFRI